ncbi:MAG: hypothetical protein A4S09_16705 [Proteobacteria bacterium SG_bin7]|nr:MAG: hypothetical protein A4S09_16705 [Proteobacteria bacterium SG_bin7]
MRTLLYLDDSKTSIHLVERFLEGLVKVIGVTTIPEAVKLAEAEDISIFLLDYQLGNRTSFEFADYIREKTQKYKNTPMVLVTAFRSDGIFYRGSKKGINEFIAKPLEKKSLRETIQLFLEKPDFRREITPKYLSAQCIAWRSGTNYHQYSPDIMQHLTGNSAEEVGKKMQEALGKKSTSIMAEVELVLHNVPYIP